jgi:hypothetical protein
MTECNRGSLSVFGPVMDSLGISARPSWSQSRGSSAHSSRVVFSIAMLLALSSLSAWAQSSSGGTVSGQVKDQQGLAVPGVEVKIIEPSTNTTLLTVSNQSGRFIIPDVSPGTYDIVFTKAGFSTNKVNRQDVKVAEILTINATLELAR